MHILRRIIVALLISILPFLLFITAVDLGLVETLSNPTQFKNIVASSGLYQNIVPAALDQAAKASGNSNSVSLSNPAVKTAAETALSPKYIQQSTESIINGIYDWLNGKVSQPDFNIDLSAKKTEFATLVANQAQKTASTLPRCTRSQDLALSRQGSNYDAFNLTCLPPGTTPASIANIVQSQLANNQSFLKNTSITANTLKKSGDSQSVFTGKLKKVPSIYAWLMRLPIILIALVILVMVGVVFISVNRRKGIRRIGAVLSVVGLVVILYSLAVNFVITKEVLPKIKITNSTVASDVKVIVIHLTQMIEKTFWTIGVIYLVIGIVAIILAWKFLKPHNLKFKKVANNSYDSTNDPKTTL